MVSVQRDHTQADGPPPVHLDLLTQTFSNFHLSPDLPSPADVSISYATVEGILLLSLQ